MPDVSRGTVATQTGSSTSSGSVSVTTSGSSRYLLVFITIVDATAGDRVISSMTYNAVALSRQQGRVFGAGSTAETEVWVLANPASGANTLSWTFAGTVNAYDLHAIPLSNVDVTGTPFDAGNGNTGTSSTSLSASTTTTADRCQGFSHLATEVAATAHSPNSGETQIASTLGGSVDTLSSEEDSVITPAGSATMGWSWTTATHASIEVVYIAPLASINIDVPAIDATATLPAPSPDLSLDVPALALTATLPAPLLAFSLDVPAIDATAVLPAVTLTIAQNGQLTFLPIDSELNMPEQPTSLTIDKIKTGLRIPK